MLINFVRVENFLLFFFFPILRSSVAVAHGSGGAFSINGFLVHELC